MQQRIFYAQTIQSCEDNALSFLDLCAACTAEAELCKPGHLRLIVSWVCSHVCFALQTFADTMGQLMDRCVNKFCSCKWSAVFSKRQNLVTGGSVPLCWSTFTPHERGCISGAGQPHGCNRNLQVQGSWSLNSLLTTFWCTFVFEATGLQSVLRKHESLRLLNWQWNAFNSHCILHASVEECAKAHLSRQSLTATFPLRGEMNGRLAFYTVLLCLCISLAIFFHLVYLVYFYTAQNMQEWCDESKRGVKPEAWHHFAFFLDGSWCWCDVMCKLDLMPLTFLALAIAVAKSQALRTDCQFGDFLKFGYSNSWMVYNVKCHWNGWFWSTPISGFPPFAQCEAGSSRPVTEDPGETDPDGWVFNISCGASFFLYRFVRQSTSFNFLYSSISAVDEEILCLSLSLCHAFSNCAVEDHFLQHSSLRGASQSSALQMIRCVSLGSVFGWSLSAQTWVAGRFGWATEYFFMWSSCEEMQTARCCKTWVTWSHLFSEIASSQWRCRDGTDSCRVSVCSLQATPCLEDAVFHKIGVESWQSVRRVG